jgi:hypothetical protein
LTTSLDIFRCVCVCVMVTDGAAHIANSGVIARGAVGTLRAPSTKHTSWPDGVADHSLREDETPELHSDSRLVRRRVAKGVAPTGGVVVAMSAASSSTDVRRSRSLLCCSTHSCALALPPPWRRVGMHSRPTRNASDFKLAPADASRKVNDVPGPEDVAAIGDDATEVMGTNGSDSADMGDPRIMCRNSGEMRMGGSA